MVTAGNPAWSNYTLSTKATKTAGAEGFLIAFGVKDTGNYYWWNLGGWNNSKSVVEKAVSGAKSTLVETGTTIEAGRQYDIRIEVTGPTAKLYLDNVLWGTIDETPVDPIYSVATKDAETGETIVKVVNTSGEVAGVDIKVAGTANISSRAAVTTLTTTSDGQNLVSAASVFTGAGTNFIYNFQPKSVTFIRLAPVDAQKAK
jgi:alpha-L-arabinofuranosidase